MSPTTSSWRELVLVALLLVWSATPAGAQRRAEWQVQTVATVTGARFAGGGLGVALRTAGRVRLGASLSGGAAGGLAAVRGEATVSYHPNPFRRRGVAPYAGGGVALTATRDARPEYLVLFLGIESNPAGRAGWFAELGVGGGVRAAGGLRLRSGRR